MYPCHGVQYPTPQGPHWSTRGCNLRVKFRQFHSCTAIHLLLRSISIGFTLCSQLHQTICNLQYVVAWFVATASRKKSRGSRGNEVGQKIVEALTKIQTKIQKSQIPPKAVRYDSSDEILETHFPTQYLYVKHAKTMYTSKTK